MKNFEDYSNQENILYSSDKNYGKMFFLLLFCTLICFVLLIFFILMLKEDFYNYVWGIIALFVALHLYLIFQEIMLFGKKIIITQNEILVFNYFGKLINKFSMQEELLFSCSDYVFQLKTKTDKKISISYEKDNFLIYDILKRNGGVSLGVENEDITLAYLKKFCSGCKIILLTIYVLLTFVGASSFCENKNEIISSYYLYRADCCFKKEIELQNSRFVKISTDSENLKKCYEYNKLACKIYPKQKQAVYDFLIVYAKTHGLEDERKEFQYFSDKFYPKN